MKNTGQDRWRSRDKNISESHQGTLPHSQALNQLLIMGQYKSFFQFLRKQVGDFGLSSLILIALEKILDQEFVCPCDRIYNIAVCFLYGAVPTVACFVLTLCSMKQSSKTEDGMIWCNSKCTKCLYPTLIAAVWLVLFFLDGRYLACGLSQWEGVYAKNDTLGVEKWCKPTGNGTSVFESQKMALKWTSRSQVSDE